MNKSLIFILFLIAGASCSEPSNPVDLNNIYEALSKQKQVYYLVEYASNNSFDRSESNLYGMVSLNRNSDSGISSAYFGYAPEFLTNYLHSIYLKSNRIYNLSSDEFQLSDADLILDTLHSPVLINPEVLLKIEEDSVKIEHHRIGENKIKFIVDLKQKADQFIFEWDHKLKRITAVEYKYDVDSHGSYSRQWAFKYLSKTEYQSLENEFKYKNQIAQQPFL